MTHPQDEETDRAVSRRVEHSTSASASDEQAYAAADNDPAPDPGGAPGATGGLPADGDSSAGGTADAAASDDESDTEKLTRSE